MISASLGYTIISGDLQKSLDRVASQTTVKREAQYYEENINKVKDVDDFLGNYKLYSYAMKAYGLEDMTYAKAFMKKVLESDLTDANSFANKLSDSRYKEFASAFNFGTAATDAQSDSQETDMLGLYTQSFADEGANAATESTYYSTAIDKVQSVTGLTSNARLRTYVLGAFGIDPTYVSNDYLSKVLTSDVNDPNSFVNTSGNAKYKALAAQFSFNADGTVNGTAQTANQKNAVIEQYNLTVPSIVTPKAAEYNKAYFDANIGSITSVDQLISDKRLTSYIKAAFGAGEDFSDAGLKRVLTDSSYAAMLGFDAINAAFNFNADGTVDATKAGYAAQTSAQIGATATAANNMSSAYSTKIAGIKTVDDLIADTKMTSYIKDAYGVPQSLSDADLRSVLTDSSYAGLLGLQAVHDAFNFQADGSVTSDGAQTASQIRLAGYNASDNLSYYRSKISALSNVDDLIADTKLTSFLKSTYSLPSTISDSDLKSILTDASFAAASGFSNVNEAFNFAADGSAAAMSGPQSTQQTTNVDTLYSAHYADEQQAEIDSSVANYKTRMADDKVTNVADFLRTNLTADTDRSNDSLPDLYQMALRSYGLTEQDVSRTMMRKLLQSDPYDPKGYVASLKDDRITDMVRAFNFGTDGKATSEVQAVSTAVLAKYGTTYKSLATLGMSAGPVRDKASKDATTEVDDFAKKIVTVKSLDDFLADSKLTDFVLKANGLDPKDYDKATLKKIFTSDPTDDKSYLNKTAPSKFKEIVADFNFDTSGNLTRSKIGAIQNVGAEERTQQGYLQMTLETQQGESNDGVRLALYFARKAPSVTSIYSLIGDQALFQVITTAYSLPTSMSNMDVDKQATMLKKFVDINDFQDPKKVDKLMNRFTAMYDLKNNTTTSPALTIMNSYASNAATINSNNKR
ncbi:MULTISPECIES: DUF1217 domain-containing protein [unclassified Rhizobium]|jgi:uncharacterized protein YunC (DUF1805 family)|uniref:DUF1217 domain-containing protein n=1 Tax=unclassified Rhizobium TaxID=2613769 RepID=UPI000DD5494F|nr:DUF1217 domain-containing protein [Rhizobium sp. UBA1881]